MFNPRERRSRSPFRERRRPLARRKLTVEVLEERFLLSSFTVTLSTDNGSGVMGSLSWAINSVNEGPNDSVGLIDFDVNGGGPQTISVTGTLPAITNPVFIKGTSQPGPIPEGEEPILIDGNPVAAVKNDGLTFDPGSDGSTVMGLAIGNFTGDAIVLNSGSNTIAGDDIGTNQTATGEDPNGDLGILIDSSGNTIGGTTAGARDVISGNFQGVVIIGEGASVNVVEGDYIGTDATGTVALGNGVVDDDGDGVDIADGATDNTIGGTTAGAHDLISGNWQGVEINGVGIGETSGNVVEGDYIGTDVMGTAVLGKNNGNGVEIEATDNTIGGTTAGARNVINFVGITGSENVVEGDYIGTDAAGTASLGIDGGVEISGVGNTIGGTTAGARNVISGNEAYGVFISFGGLNVVEGDYIGTDVTGTATLGNLAAGVDLDNSAEGNTIGGTTAGACNVISGNGIGVEITDDDSTGNAILENSIYGNTGLGINLNESSPSGNPVGASGPNNLQNAPVLTSALNSVNSGVTTTTIIGTVSSTPNTPFRIEFFSNPSGTSQGETYLGFDAVTTNGSGQGSFAFSPVSSVAIGLNITATATDMAPATDQSGDTSEFSTASTVAAAPKSKLVLIDVTSDLSIKFGGFVLNRKTGQFTQSITITNTSGAAITGPIEMVVPNLKYATLVNQTGVYSGSSYITILSSGSLGIGQSLSFSLVFADPTLQSITYTAEFLAGPIPPQS